MFQGGAETTALSNCAHSLQPNLSNTTNADDLFKDRTSECGTTCAAGQRLRCVCHPLPHMGICLPALASAVLCVPCRDIRHRLPELNWRPRHREYSV